MAKLNPKHQELLDRVKDDTMGCEEAVRQFFRGRFFEQDAALAISGALFNRERFARQMQDKYAIEGDLTLAASWEDIGNKWNEAFTNVYEQVKPTTETKTAPDKDFKGLENNPKTTREVTEELHDHALDILPPVYGKGCFGMGEIYSGDSYFWFTKIGEKFFGFLGTQAEAERAFLNKRFQLEEFSVARA